MSAQPLQPIKLEIRPFIPSSSSQNLKFEIVDSAELLQSGLSSAVQTVTTVWSLCTTFFGLIPKNSIKDKFPYHRSATATALPLPKDLLWLLRVKVERREAAGAPPVAPNASQAEPSSYKPIVVPTSSNTFAASFATANSLSQLGLKPRRGRKKYVRDSLTSPMMFIVYNVVLVWAMFNIEGTAATL